MPRAIRRVKEIQGQCEDDMEGIVGAQADSVGTVMVDTDSIKQQIIVVTNSYAYDVDDDDENEYKYAYEGVENKMSALYVDKGKKCGSPNLCDDGTLELPSMSNIVDDNVHLGIHTLNTKMKENVERMNSVKPVKPYYAEMSIEGKPVKMEIDTGASRTTISEHVYETQFKHMQLKPTDVVLRSYTGDVPILGELPVNVCHDKHKHKLIC